MEVHRPVTQIPTLTCVALAALLACGPDGAQEFVHAAEERALEAEASGETPSPKNGEPPEIYYDLTRYEWYRRGQPLLVDGQPFRPAGRPEPTRAREFTELGRYEGVTYYIVADSEPPHTVVYVPVSPGYWQPFELAAPGSASDDGSGDGASR